MFVVQSALDLVGKTPLIRLNKVMPKEHNFWGKAEFLNPGGSVKDRIAQRIIEHAEKEGRLKPGYTIIEATSGNTGVGLAMVAAIKGYKTVIVMPSKMSKEKIDLLKAFGSEVVITPTGLEPDHPESHYSVAKRLEKEIPNSFRADQFFNEQNWLTHYHTTGPEIWEQCQGKIDLFVGGGGTGGTISGVGKYLKEKNPNVKIVLADPYGSILHDNFYFKETRTPPAPYLVEGIGEDMIPSNMKFEYVDDVVQVADKDAFQMCRDIVRQEGLFIGPSTGALMWAAKKYSEKMPKNSNIVSLFCDSGDRYVSKVFNDEWMKANQLI